MSEVHLYTTDTAFETAKDKLVYRGHSMMARSYVARGVVRASYAWPHCQRRSPQGKLARKEAPPPYSSPTPRDPWWS